MFRMWRTLFNGEEIEIHHIVSVAEGGTDDMENIRTPALCVSSTDTQNPSQISLEVRLEP
jgi:hypothetical protein